MTSNDLIGEVHRLKSIPEVRLKVDQKLRNFSSFQDKSTEEWFSEMCFCLLTSNSKASTALFIQEELGADGFINHPPETVKEVIMKHKHRFHNTKTRYICEARKHIEIKHTIDGILSSGKINDVREWLVDNVKGFAYKEASHYLRNVGFFNLAILDRHILNLMLEYGYISEKPKTLNRARYLENEEKFKKIADSVSMNCAELDFYMWYMKAGDVLK